MFNPSNFIGDSSVSFLLTVVSTLALGCILITVLFPRIVNLSHYIWRNNHKRNLCDCDPRTFSPTGVASILSSDVGNEEGDDDTEAEHDEYDEETEEPKSRNSFASFHLSAGDEDEEADDLEENPLEDIISSEASSDEELEHPIYRRRFAGGNNTSYNSNQHNSRQQQRILSKQQKRRQQHEIFDILNIEYLSGRSEEDDDGDSSEINISEEDGSPRRTARPWKRNRRQNNNNNSQLKSPQKRATQSLRSGSEGEDSTGEVRAHDAEDNDNTDSAESDPYHSPNDEERAPRRLPVTTVRPFQVPTSTSNRSNNTSNTSNNRRPQQATRRSFNNRLSPVAEESSSSFALSPPFFARNEIGSQ